MSFRPKYIVDSSSEVLSFRPYSRVLTEMSPSRFLSIVPPNAEHEPSLLKVRERLSGGRPLDPLFVDVDVDRGVIMNHEGRHRAKAAHDLGVEKIPVVVFARAANSQFVPLKKLNEKQRQNLDRFVS